MYIKLLTEVPQEVLITSIIKEAVELADKLNIVVMFNYAKIKVEIPPNSNRKEIYKNWSIRFKPPYKTQQGS